MQSQSITSLYTFNLDYARQLVHDIDDDLIAHTPGPGLENHPAFTIGHLCTAAALTAKYLGEPYTLDEQWDQIFRRRGPGDPKVPSTDRTIYPDKAVLMNELTVQHERVERLIEELPDDRLTDQVRWRFMERMPTLIDMLYFMCVTHEAMHLSQLAAWRRAMEMPSALAQM